MRISRFLRKYRVWEWVEYMIIKPLMQKKMSTPKAPQFRKRICSNTMNRAVIPRKAWMLSKCRL